MYWLKEQNNKTYFYAFYPLFFCIVKKNIRVCECLDIACNKNFSENTNKKQFQLTQNKSNPQPCFTRVIKFLIPQVYQSFWGRILSCEEGKGTSTLHCGEEYNAEKKGRNILVPMKLRLLLGRISSREKGKGALKIWGRQSKSKILGVGKNISLYGNIHPFGFNPQIIVWMAFKLLFVPWWRPGLAGSWSNRSPAARSGARISWNRNTSFGRRAAPGGTQCLLTTGISIRKKSRIWIPSGKLCENYTIWWENII